MAQIDTPPSTSNETPGVEPNKGLDEAARALKEKVGTEASELGAGTKQLAEDFAEEARGRAQTKLSGGKERAALGLGTLAEALRSSGEQLRSDEQETLPEYLDGAAEKLERASDYLRYTDLSDVVHDVESFARREPALFVGGAFALGLIGGRFLKSSGKRSNPQLRDTQSPSLGSASSIGKANSKSGGAQRLQGTQRRTGNSSQQADGLGGGPSSTDDRTSSGSKSRDNGNPSRPGDTRVGDVG